MLQQIFTLSFMTAFLAAAVRLAVPLMYGGIGETIAEKSGILNTLMEAIEPYNFQEAVPFQQAYLAGYLADRYDVNVDERIGRARDRIRVCTERAFRKTVRGYNGGASVKDSNVQIHNASYWYAMYPVWLLNTTWHGQKFTFAMNGQTGKMVGDLPIDKSKFWKSVGIRTFLIWGVLYGLKCLFLM